MRKIEKEMLEAIHSRKDWHNDNTVVFFFGAGETGNPHGSRSEVYLHGNHIASFWHDSGDVEYNSHFFREWPTRTTVSRLRALGIPASGGR